MEDNFLLECGYMTARLEEIVLAAANARRFTADHINEMFRIMHTIKGSAGIMMHENISILAHKLEDVFYYLRETYPESVPHEELVEGILLTADFITAQLVKIQLREMVDENGEDIHAFLDRFLARIKEDIREEREEPLPENVYTAPKQFYVAPKADEVKNYYRVDIYYRLGTEMSNVRAYTAVFALRDAVEDIIYAPEDIATDNETAGIILREGFHIQLQTMRTREEIRALVEDSSGVKDITIQDSSVEEFLLGFQDTDTDAPVIRLDDDWMAEQEKAELMPGDYVVRKDSGKRKVLQGNRLRLPQSQDIINIPLEKLDILWDLTARLTAYGEISEELSQLINEIQEAVLSMRKVSMKGIFHKMDRAVYDISRKLNKGVVLETVGEDTEIDRNITGLLSDSLMHILRNAVDHGIEDKKERLEKGKTARGNILLEAGSRGNEIYVSVSDDGRGLDPVRIFEIALERGLTEGKEQGELSDQEIYRFIMCPGFSTRHQVTEYSGRGVGLDVVAQNVEILNGRIEVDSIPGQGMEMILWIPKRNL